MRMLQLHAGYRIPAGEDSVVAAEADAFRRAGHDVHQHIEQNPTSSVRAVSALARSPYNRSVADRVREVVATFPPDVVHVHNTWFSLSSSIFDVIGDLPTVMTIHNYRLGCLSVDLFRGASVCTACVGRSPLRGVLHACYRGSRTQSALAAVEVMSTRRRRSLDAVDRFVVPSEFMGDRLIDIGVPADRMTVKPHFTADAGPRRNKPSESNDVLFIGRLAAGKGLEVLLRAWERRPRAADCSLRLCIVGDGPLASELHESAPRSVEFTGWLPSAEVQRRMLSARALVFPSEWYEPFGMVLIEAMSAGLPVLASNAAAATAITGTPTELISVAGDDRSLARALSSLTDDLVDAAGDAARARFESTYSEPIGVAGLEALYTSVIDGGGR